MNQFVYILDLTNGRRKGEHNLGSNVQEVYETVLNDNKIYVAIGKWQDTYYFVSAHLPLEAEISDLKKYVAFEEMEK